MYTIELSFKIDFYDFTLLYTIILNNCQKSFEKIFLLRRHYIFILNYSLKRKKQISIDEPLIHKKANGKENKKLFIEKL